MLYPFHCPKCKRVFTVDIMPKNRNERVRCETEGCDGWADRSLVVDVEFLEGVETTEIPVMGRHF